MMNKINDEMLENVNAGYIFFNGECWEIIDWCGNVIDHRYSKEYAKDRAGALGQDTMELTWEMLQTIRKKNGGN